MRPMRYRALFVLLLSVLAFLTLARDTHASPGATSRVSVASDGTQGNLASQPIAISADGRFVSFQSLASNLVPGDTNICSSFTDPGTCPDIFVYDRQTGVSERVSVDSAGGQANADSSGGVSISADGRFVAFESSASNLVPGDTNLCGASSCADVFV